MPKIEINGELCKSCKLCIVTCPQKLIEIGAEFNSQGDRYAVQTDGSKCVGCKMCAIMCPESAITVYR